MSEFRPRTTWRAWSASLSAAVTATLVCVGCGTLEARYHPPPLPVDDAWPIAPAAVEGSVTDIGWREFFVDPRLEELIALALAHNRDLRVAVLTVERARATYQIQRAARFPAVSAAGSFTAEREPPFLIGTPSAETLRYYSADVGVSNFELDLFGRVASLSHAALEQYFAETEARRAAQLSLIAEVANAYLTAAADRERERLALATLKSQQRSYELTEQRHAQGAVSALDLSQARTTVESARADAASYAGAVAQDDDALTLLIGTHIDPSLMPDRFVPQVSGLGPLPAGLPSTVLLRRPDVLDAEHVLRAADASIGAARAAFFPQITLTGEVGAISADLSGLFKTGSGVWSFVPQVTIPIFQGGQLRASLRMAKVDREIALARYEQAIQTGFREASDALALTATLANQRTAQEALVEATSSAFALSTERYKSGKDSYLNVLDAERSDYAAQQSLITTRLAEQSNRVTLYKALGGGWRELGTR
jgi:multidrug efflux system outer membrane protein